ncbi:MAG TPA: hypothetical protein VGQ24_02340 [Gemmatimonadales bacterium]|nr:hypothetical protein [Gemmatimonadales bacterium]
MRVLTVIPLSAAVGAIVAVLPAGLLTGTAPRTQAYSNSCRHPIGAAVAACADSEPQEGPGQRPLPAGDAPAFLFASVQPIKAPESWRTVYREVERCAGMVGDYEQVRWAVMDAPLQGPKGPTYGFNVGSRIVLVRNDTTYLRHEMLHHVLQTAGWQPRTLQPGEHYTIADLHPVSLFGLCTGGR